MNHFFLGSPAGLCPSLHHCKNHSSGGLLVSLSLCPLGLWASQGRDPACFFSVPQAEPGAYKAHISTDCKDRIKWKLVMPVCSDAYLDFSECHWGNTNGKKLCSFQCLAVLPRLHNFLFPDLCSEEQAVAQWMNEKGRTGTSVRDQLNQPPVAGWTMRLKVWQWVPGRRRRKMQVSGFAGTVPPSTHHLLIQIRAKMSRISRVRVEGHPAAGCLARPSLPPHLWAWQCPGVPSILSRMQVISQQNRIMFAKDIWKKCQEHSKNERRELGLAVSLLPWPRATPCWCFLLPKDTEGNLKLLQGVGPQMQEEHFPHWCFKTISQSPNHQPHAITGLKAKNASLDCVCVCVLKHK